VTSKENVLFLVVKVGKSGIIGILLGLLEVVA
jgi:hypothetical protein